MIREDKSIMPVLEVKYESFTPVEKNIADFFLKNAEIGDLSARRIAGALYVSEASLSRFAKKCGFRGYREFVYQYERSFQAARDFMGAENTTEVFENYREIMEKTHSLLEDGQIHRIVKQLYQKKRVIVCGKGSSGMAAQEMEIRFMRIGVDVDSVCEDDRIRMQSVFLDKSMMVMGFSLSGETESVLYLLREAHARGAFTVLMTSKDDPRFRDYCDELVLLASRRYLSGGNIISPQLPILLLLDIIYNAYVMKDRYQTEALHGNTLRALMSGERAARTELS